VARPGPPRRARQDIARRGTKKRVCRFCAERADWVDYKDVALLRRFMSERGKIRARRVTGNCAQHQRDVAVAIKTARELALLPYAQRTVTERAAGRGRGGPARLGRRDVEVLGLVPTAPEAEGEQGPELEDLAAPGPGDGLGDGADSSYQPKGDGGADAVGPDAEQA